MFTSYFFIYLADQRKFPQQRAMYEYLRGKILDVFPDYRKEAEDHLSKAVRTDISWLIYCVLIIRLRFLCEIENCILQVKLNPSLADAWLCLGNCIWKKGDLPSAKNCFNLALSKVCFVCVCFSE